MSNVKWPCAIPPEGILGVKFYNWFAGNKKAFNGTRKTYNVDRRLFIALAATILDGIPTYGLSAINHMGIYVDRNVRGTSVKSTHSMGLGIDISGIKASSGTYWIDTDTHKEILEQYAHNIFFKYFEDIVTWDCGQYRGKNPFSFSYKTKELHKNHYHLNPTRWSRFRVKTDIYHNASISRILDYLCYNNIKDYQIDNNLKSDGIAGKFTTLELVKDLGGNFA